MFLAVDTASDILSVALMEGQEVLGYRESSTPQAQGEQLFILTQELFDELHLSPSSLTGVGVCVGPGSFTGVRIGLAAAKGLGLALNIPVMGATSFEVFAEGLEKPATVILDTKKNSFWVQSFDADGQAVSPVSLLSAEEIQRHSFSFVVGSGATRVAELTGCSVVSKKYPSSVAVGRIVAGRLDNPLPPVALYCKDPYVS